MRCVGYSLLIVAAILLMLFAPPAFAWVNEGVFTIPQDVDHYILGGAGYGDKFAVVVRDNVNNSFYVLVFDSNLNLLNNITSIKINGTDKGELKFVDMYGDILAFAVHDSNEGERWIVILNVTSGEHYAVLGSYEVLGEWIEDLAVVGNYVYVTYFDDNESDYCVVPIYINGTVLYDKKVCRYVDTIFRVGPDLLGYEGYDYDAGESILVIARVVDDGSLETVVEVPQFEDHAGYDTGGVWDPRNNVVYVVYTRYVFGEGDTMGIGVINLTDGSVALVATCDDAGIIRFVGLPPAGHLIYGIYADPDYYPEDEGTGVYRVVDGAVYIESISGEPLAYIVVDGAEKVLMKKSLKEIRLYSNYGSGTVVTTTATTTTTMTVTETQPMYITETETETVTVTSAVPGTYTSQDLFLVGLAAFFLALAMGFVLARR